MLLWNVYLSYKTSYSNYNKNSKLNKKIKFTLFT